jgi:hypothetical protein
MSTKVQSKSAKSSRTSKPRYFKNDTPLAKRDPHKQLLASLERIVTKYPPDSVAPGGGFYHGPVSIGYLFFVLDRIYGEGTVQIQELDLGIWAAAYLKRAKDTMMTYPGPDKDRCGISTDIMCLLAIDAASTRDKDLVRELCDFADVVTERDACNEWLYGRAGYLYLLRFVRYNFTDDPEVKAMIDETADEVIDEIMESSKPWRWHGKAYGKWHCTSFTQFISDQN